VPFIGDLVPIHSAQEVEVVSISYQGLNLLSVKIQRNLMKNTVGKNSFGGEDSWWETGMEWAGAGHWAAMMGHAGAGWATR
jgi:hypothetical protein